LLAGGKGKIIFYTHNEDTNWQNYKHELAPYKKAIRRAKRTAWQTFCSEIEKATDAERLKKILSKTAAPLGYLQKANGSWSDSSRETLDLLIDAHIFREPTNRSSSRKKCRRRNQITSPPITPQH